MLKMNFLSRRNVTIAAILLVVAASSGILVSKRHAAKNQLDSKQPLQSQPMADAGLHLPPDNEPVTAEPILRRLTSDQYKQIVTDVFGPRVSLGGRLEPDIRQSGLLALGSSKVSITPSGFEQYDAMARAIAAQIVDGPLSTEVMPCKPVSPYAPDSRCARTFLESVGRLLYRRPLSPVELDEFSRAAVISAKTLHSFNAGLRLSLAAMLESPEFLFRREEVNGSPDRDGGYRLDSYSVASRLSFFLWNTAPDTELLDAAGKGQLDQSEGLGRQVDRLLASPRLEAGVRAFFSDMLALEGFRNLTKDEKIYPGFSSETARDATEQTLRTIVNIALVRNEDFRNVFTSSQTFLTPELGAIYGVPLAATAPNGAPSWWRAYEYKPKDPRAGILSQVSFVALHSHPGRSSPTLRGRALRELLFCTKVPDPPANIDFSLVNNTANPTFKTARERLTVHRNNPVCAGCHRIVDPMGLALENFDSSGAFRTTENDAIIDASGDLDGVRFADAAGLAQAVHDNPRITKCLVNRLYAYATGRESQKNERKFLVSLEENFKTDGYQLRSLLKQIATSSESYRVRPPATGPSGQLADAKGLLTRTESTR